MEKVNAVLDDLLKGLESNLYFIIKNSYGVLRDFNAILVHVDSFIIKQLNSYLESKNVDILHALQNIVNTPEYKRVLEDLFRIYNCLFTEITCTIEFDTVGSILQLSVFLLSLGSYMNTIFDYNFMKALEFSKIQLGLYSKTEFFTVNRDININYNISKKKKEEILNRNYHVVNIKCMEL